MKWRIPNLLLIGVLLGSTYRLYHGFPFTGRWAAAVTLLILAGHLLDRWALKPYLDDQKRRQAALRVVLAEVRGVEIPDGLREAPGPLGPLQHPDR
jgi:hypothetical protein